MKKRISQGKCQLCQTTFSKTVITRHLDKCLEKQEAAKSATGKAAARPTKLLHLVVEGKYDPHYWLHLEVSARATLADLDSFLRHIWLECCDHLSAFTIGGRRFAMNPFGGGMDAEGMEARLGQVLRPGMKFTHEYDFGSTTHLNLRVISERDSLAPSKDAIHLLARNEPPLIPCGGCGEPATHILTEEAWDPSGWLCDKCAKKRGVHEEESLPVANSPRVGVCGYTGF
jgi:hypothetical protein